MDHVYLQAPQITPRTRPRLQLVSLSLLALNDILKRFRKTLISASLFWEINTMHGFYVALISIWPVSCTLHLCTCFCTSNAECVHQSSSLLWQRPKMCIGSTTTEVHSVLTYQSWMDEQEGRKLQRKFKLLYYTNLSILITRLGLVN